MFAVACALGTLCLTLAWLNYKLRAKCGKLIVELQLTRQQLEEATRMLAEFEASAKPGGLFQKAVSALIGMKVAGLVLLAIMATSGFAGAAAITSALAFLGGPFGMLGGIATLVALAMASKAIAEYGFPKLAEAVVRGLIVNGETKESITRTLDSIPRWIMSTEARSKATSTLETVK